VAAHPPAAAALMAHVDPAPDRRRARGFRSRGTSGLACGPMDALRKLTLLVGAITVALLLFAGPALAVEDDATEAPATQDEGGRIEIAETPRDRLGLILLGVLVAAGGLALANGRRQLKGDRPQASGEFRWR
jgi:hypothetical protein